MNKADFQLAILDRLSNRSLDTSLEDVIIRQADIVQRAIEKSGRKFDFQITEFEGFFSQSGEVPIDQDIPPVGTEPDVTKMDIATDFLSLAWDGSLRIYESQFGDLLSVAKRKPFSELEFKFGAGRGPTQPFYALVNRILHLYPGQPLTRLLRYHYHASAPLISGLAPTETNYWLEEADDYMIAHTGIVIASQVIKDAEAVQLFNAAAIVADKRLDLREAAAEQDDWDAAGEDQI